MSIVNKPNISRTIVLSYEILFTFMIAVTIFFLYCAFFTPMGIVGVAASFVSTFVGAIMFMIVASLYRTRYILTDAELIIRTTKLIGGNKTVPLKTVRSIEKTIIPFGIRLFGASFHGGHYHIPGLGRAFLSITNLNDGLLIKADHGNYIITPNNPLKFKEVLESRVEKS